LSLTEGGVEGLEQSFWGETARAHGRHALQNLRKKKKSNQGWGAPVWRKEKKGDNNGGVPPEYFKKKGGRCKGVGNQPQKSQKKRKEGK